MHGCQNDGCGSGDCSTRDSTGTTHKGGGGGGGSWGAAGGTSTKPQPRPNCLKCKQAPAVVAVRQREPLCWGCLEYNVLGKVRSAVKTQGLVQPGDRVLVPVSGGPASLALVYLLLQIQSTNEERLERGKVVFQLEVVHVDEAVAGGLSEDQAAASVQAVGDSVRAAGYGGDTHILQLQANDADAASDGSLEQLAACLPDMGDVTAREDAVRSLRRRRVQQYAEQAGCNKIAWGACASSTAVQIIADFAKGRGFSLAADIQLADARAGAWQPASIYLLRGVSSKELAMVCRHHGVRFWSMPVLPQQARSSINQLAEGFMESLQAQVPHTIYTVIRTASHLQPFPFNRLPSTPSAARAPPSPGSGPSPAVHKPATPAGSGSKDDDTPEAVLRWCRVCGAPLRTGISTGAQGSAVAVSNPEMCYSCRNQFGRYLLADASAEPGRS